MECFNGSPTSSPQPGKPSSSCSVAMVNSDAPLSGLAPGGIIKSSATCSPPASILSHRSFAPHSCLNRNSSSVRPTHLAQIEALLSAAKLTPMPVQYSILRTSNRFGAPVGGKIRCSSWTCEKHSRQKAPLEQSRASSLATGGDG
uniref:(northern house mosquito) hypothetical protein n=1 Tax=Culex pipiens TaxID=7175 RepID=A0A8D8BNB5_CULPI